MRLRNRLKTAVVVLFCLFLSPLSGSGEQLVIMTGQWPPYVSPTMENLGFTAEIVTRACRAAGLDAVIEFAPWPRCEAGVENGKIFAAMPYTRTDKREKFAFFSRPIGESKTLLVYNSQKHEKISFQKVKDLKPLLVGGVRGYFYQPLFENAGLCVDYSENETALLKKLLYKRIDIAPVNELVGCSIINTEFAGRQDHFTACAKPLSIDPLSLMVSKKYPESALLLQKFNRGLATIMKNGVYRSILTRQENFHRQDCSFLQPGKNGEPR
ncbi:MAG: transporter substrate-binding domain-containing protein [Desulfobacteraceae bacterium]